MKRLTLGRPLSAMMLGAGVLLSALGPAFASNDPTLEGDDQRTAAIKYFLAHSFDFAPIFNIYHHPPGWIERRKKELHLTDAQVKEEQALTSGMGHGTAAAMAPLKQAYKKYAADSALPNPSIKLILQDIKDIGRKETKLASVMIPYHLKAYKILNPDQRKIYATLEAKFLKELSLSMYQDTFNFSK